MNSIVHRALGWAQAAIAAAALTFAAASSAQAQIDITDVLGRHVTLEKPAEKVMLGFYFEDYIAITGPSAIDRLKAVSLNYWKGYRPAQYDAYLKAFPKIADLVDVGDADAGTLSAEKIIAARPDVVILSAGQYKYLGAAAQTIEQVGIPLVVVDYNAQTVEKHVASTLIIGQVMGTEDRAQKLADQYKDKIADTIARVEKASKAIKPKVYVELGQKGAAEYGNTYGSGMWAGTIDLAGGQNIAAGQVASWGPLNPEYVISSKPDAIFLSASEWVSLPNSILAGFGIPEETTRERAAPYLQRAGWQDLPAVRNGEVYVIYHGGNRTIYDYAYLRYMAKALYPDAFADVDPQAELKAYYDAYLPIRLDGTFMLKIGNKT
ncbi:ABC transporter substrate-binding protein [Aliirhizobium terrae]|uniref:ABC transporter substrate-binding protein n=1 Tax=Terrirhizobium terrae TaxID=2926709 RepID=UPI0025788325|nr:ABC transporter substrate-binding protein [Rhizobium sp. CC-CFT758]WJH41688.1 ABC transporter substrate-binding protein [Rhizobium sp. CC-CFT758]